MTTRGKIQYDITAKTAQFTSAMNKVDNRLKGMQKGLKNIAAVAGGAFAVGQIGSFISESVRLFQIQEQAQIKLKTALDGNINAYKELTKQASALQKMTLFGDEQTIEAQAQLAALIDNVDAIKQLTPLVQDLAVLLNMGLSQAAALVAKSVGSSTNALSRYGIQIEGAVGSTERLESAMKGIQEVAGGQAMAQALETATGKVTQLKNAWGDVREAIGSASLEIGTLLLDAITGGRSYIQRQATAGMLSQIRQQGNINKYSNSIFGFSGGPTSPSAPAPLTGFNPMQGFEGFNPADAKAIADSWSTVSTSVEEVAEFIGPLADEKIEKIKIDMSSVNTNSENFKNSFSDVSGILSGVNSLLGQMNVKLGEAARIIGIIQSILSIANLLSGFGLGGKVASMFGLGSVTPGMANPLKPGGFNILGGIKSSNPVLRGQDLVGAVDASRAVGTSLGVISGN